MDPIQCTAGAIPVLNDKGELSMQKVKVHRYVSGKRPEYAPSSSSDEESEDDNFLEQNKRKDASPPPDSFSLTRTDRISDDPRLKRILAWRLEDEGDGKSERRRIEEPEILESSSEDEGRMDMSEGEKDEEEDDEDLSDGEIERRRQALRQKVLVHKIEQSEILDKVEEKIMSSEGSEEEISEYEEYTDSDEETETRLKPVFKRKSERQTTKERDNELDRQIQEEKEAKKKSEERRRQTLRMVEEEIKKEQTVENKEEGCIDDVDTDDENDEVEYESWKLREMKRNKRDKEEREQRERELMEIERLRNLTDEERRQEFRLNPKIITNKNVKGKYKFMQKYFHRGVFYLDKDEEVFQRNFAAATLEDHYNKTVLPKVMQVKNFGRSGRTKYTHLVDQDTTQFDSPWISETAQNVKFHNNQAAGAKNIFSRPSLRKHKHK